jgi:hypothetical protein
VYSERTQHVLIQESVGILDTEPPCTKHVLAQCRGVCPQWVQVARDAEETADDYVMLLVGYAGAVGTSLWSEIKEDRAKVVWLNSSIMMNLIPNPRLIVH